MHTKDLLTEEEATDFAKSLIEEDNTVDIAKTANGCFRVCWIKNKKYIAQDGKEFTDEVWSTIDGTMIAIQDLTPEHAKNILRRILRQEREFYKAANNVLEQIAANEENQLFSELGDNKPKVLH